MNADERRFKKDFPAKGGVAYATIQTPVYRLEMTPAILELIPAADRIT
jgi:hypothetical protein